MAASARAVHRRRRAVLALCVAGAAALAATQLAPDDDHARALAGARRAVPARGAASSTSAAARALAGAASARAPAAPPRLVVAPSASPGRGWTAVAHVGAAPAAWLAQRSGVTLLRVDQGLVHVVLHAGINDGGETGWTYGDHVTRREVHRLVAAFNGGFKLSYGDVGFLSGRHVAVPLSGGLASLVTYTDGHSDIGTWGAGVPAAGARVLSVLQNERLLVDHGRPAASVHGCVLSCWGATIGDASSVARTGLGVTARGQLVWAAGEQLTPAELAHALVAAGAVRAMELDINPYWVAGYLYAHGHGGPQPVPIVPGQRGIAGAMLEPDPRDFLTVVANR
jgi:hypothetical protein